MYTKELCKNMADRANKNVSAPPTRRPANGTRRRPKRRRRHVGLHGRLHDHTLPLEVCISRRGRVCSPRSADVTKLRHRALYDLLYTNPHWVPDPSATTSLSQVLIRQSPLSLSPARLTGSQIPAALRALLLAGWFLGAGGGKGAGASIHIR